jgi:energy-converting hydrogenase Eha subunit E
MPGTHLVIGTMDTIFDVANHDEVVKTLNLLANVIPAKAGIQ